MATELDEITAEEKAHEADTRAWSAATEQDREQYASYLATHPHRDPAKRVRGETGPDRPSVYFARRRLASRPRAPWEDAADEWAIAESTRDRSMQRPERK